jgi:dCTP deaminase
MQGILVDHQIKSLGLVTPLQEDLVQPASVDLTLGHNHAVLLYSQKGAGRSTAEYFRVGFDQPEYSHSWGFEDIVLLPNDLVLVETAETLTLPIDVSGKFEGKSSLGRIGLMTHITAGFIDPGFHGVLTLELYNCGPLKLILKAGIRIGQVSFTALDGIPERAYGHPDLGSHYQYAKSVQGGKF